MSATFFPMDSVVTQDSESGVLSFDRAINSEIYRYFLNSLFTTGVQADPEDTYEYLKVKPSEGMYVTINPGFALVNGLMFREDELRTISIPAASSQDRIDTIVVRSNTSSSQRTCDFYVVVGTPSASPSRPPLTRAGSIYEIGLADILVPAYTTAISESFITDTRYDSTRAGSVSINADIQLDDRLSPTSTNGVKNRTLYNEFQAVKNQVNLKVSSFNANTGVLNLTSVTW